jgi:hypothetical protein
MQMALGMNLWRTTFANSNMTTGEESMTATIAVQERSTPVHSQFNIDRT